MTADVDDTDSIIEATKREQWLEARTLMFAHADVLVRYVLPRVLVHVAQNPASKSETMSAGLVLDEARVLRKLDTVVGPGAARAALCAICDLFSTGFYPRPIRASVAVQDVLNVLANTVSPELDGVCATALEAVAKIRDMGLGEVCADYDSLVTQAHAKMMELRSCETP